MSKGLVGCDDCADDDWPSNLSDSDRDKLAFLFRVAGSIGPASGPNAAKSRLQLVGRDDRADPPADELAALVDREDERSGTLIGGGGIGPATGRGGGGICPVWHGGRGWKS